MRRRRFFQFDVFPATGSKHDLPIQSALYSYHHHHQHFGRRPTTTNSTSARPRSSSAIVRGLRPQIRSTTFPFTPPARTPAPVPAPAPGPHIRRHLLTTVPLSPLSPIPQLHILHSRQLLFPCQPDSIFGAQDAKFGEIPCGSKLRRNNLRQLIDRT